jgi:hypothetical protein
MAESLFTLHQSVIVSFIVVVEVNRWLNRSLNLFGIVLKGGNSTVPRVFGAENRTPVVQRLPHGQQQVHTLLLDSQLLEEPILNKNCGIKR